MEKTEYPYLTDFEPAKREMVELVSETGEALTQSASNLNVRKGTTTTDSMENSDINRGSSSSANFGVAWGLVSGGGWDSTSLKSGSSSTLGTQGVNLVTTDASRERRESYFHTTSLW